MGESRLLVADAPNKREAAINRWSERIEKAIGPIDPKSETP